MSIILGSTFYIIGFIVAFIIFTLLEKRSNDPEALSTILWLSSIWILVVIFMPIAFGFVFLNDKYNQFVGRRS